MIFLKICNPSRVASLEISPACPSKSINILSITTGLQSVSRV